MVYTGPLNIDAFETDTGDRELHLSFKVDFRVLPLEEQSANFREYINYLIKEIQALDESNADRLGMANILQICQQLQPHIDANELLLEDTIVVNIQAHDPFGNIKIIN